MTEDVLTGYREEPWVSRLMPLSFRSRSYLRLERIGEHDWPFKEGSIELDHDGHGHTIDQVSQHLKKIDDLFSGSRPIALFNSADTPTTCTALDEACLARWSDDLPSRYLDYTIWPIARANFAHYFFVVDGAGNTTLRIVWGRRISGNRKWPRLSIFASTETFFWMPIIGSQIGEDMIDRARRDLKPADALAAMKLIFFEKINHVIAHAIVSGPEDPLINLKDEDLSVEYLSPEEFLKAIDHVACLSAVLEAGDYYDLYVARDLCKFLVSSIYLEDREKQQKVQEFLTAYLLPAFRPSGSRILPVSNKEMIKSSYSRHPLSFRRRTIGATGHEKLTMVANLSRLLTERLGLDPAKARQALLNLTELA